VTERRLACATLFLLANVLYVGLVAQGVVSAEMAGAYFFGAMAWALKLSVYRHRDHRRRDPHR
jgi:hypothetical protein